MTARNHCLIAPIVLCLVCLSTLLIADEAGSALESQQTRDTRDRFNQAIERQDADAIGGLLAPSYHIVTGRSELAHSRDEAVENWRSTFRDDPTFVCRRTPHDVTVNAAWGLAQEVGHWSCKYHVDNEVGWDKQHIDILTARYVLQPQRFDVVAATNLFGDILSTSGRRALPARGPPARRHRHADRAREHRGRVFGGRRRDVPGHRARVRRADLDLHPHRQRAAAQVRVRARARTRPRRHLTLATKSNGISISMPWWDERCAEVAAQYPDVGWDKQHIDILTARFVLQPQRFDVVAATKRRASSAGVFLCSSATLPR